MFLAGAAPAGGQGTGYAFVFFALATVAGFFLFIKFLSETKGRSLEEPEKHTIQ